NDLHGTAHEKSGWIAIISPRLFRLCRIFLPRATDIEGEALFVFPSYGRAFFIIPRVVGLAAHALEETTRECPFRSIDINEVVYFGQADGSNRICAELADEKHIDEGKQATHQGFENHGNRQKQQRSADRSFDAIVRHTANGIAHVLPPRSRERYGSGFFLEFRG